MLCIRKTELEVEIGCVTELHGHGDERGPTEVTSRCIITNNWLLKSSGREQLINMCVCLTGTSPWRRIRPNGSDVKYVFVSRFYPPLTVYCQFREEETDVLRDFFVFLEITEEREETLRRNIVTTRELKRHYSLEDSHQQRQPRVVIALQELKRTSC